MTEDVGGLIDEALFELLAHPSIALFLTPVVDQYPEVAEVCRPASAFGGAGAWS